MIKTSYICDRCKAEQPTDDQFWKIGVFAAPVAAPLYSYFKSEVANRSLQVCRPCLEYFGILVQKKPNEVSTLIHTTEDILLELLERGRK